MKVNSKGLRALILFATVFANGCSDKPCPTCVTPTPLRVLSVQPANGDTVGVLNGVITVTFSRPVDPTTVTTQTFSLAQSIPFVNGISGKVSAEGAVATFVPYQSLSYGRSYTATVDGVQDMGGNGLAEPYRWVFMTGQDKTPFLLDSGSAVTNLALDKDGFHFNGYIRTPSWWKIFVGRFDPAGKKQWLDTVSAVSAGNFLWPRCVADYNGSVYTVRYEATNTVTSPSVYN